MSTQSTQPEANETPIPFSKSFAKIMYVNSRHASFYDWQHLQTTDLLHSIHDEIDTYFLAVPEDNYYLHQSLIDNGFSFAFVSLLQVAVRNSASWIHLAPSNQVISGIHIFPKVDTIQ